MCAHKERARAKKICVSARVDLTRFFRIEEKGRKKWRVHVHVGHAGY